MYFELKEIMSHCNKILVQESAWLAVTRSNYDLELEPGEETATF